ncbi:MAG: mobile mystery protein A [Mangrovibacterium sp.]
MDKRKLQLEQLDRKLQGFYPSSNIVPPPTGWIRNIRQALGISLQQLADKLSISKQAIQGIETRERDGNISIRNLNEVASALDMKVVYAVVPKSGTLEELIERKARELAMQIVSRTSNSMKLEDQENSKERIDKAIDERTILIKNEMPKALWD